MSIRPLPPFLARVLYSSPHAEQALHEIPLFVPAYVRWELVRRQRASTIVSSPAVLYTGFEGYYAGFDMTPAVIVEGLAARAVASLRSAQKLGEDVDRYVRILEGACICLEDLSHLSVILGATLSRLRVLRYEKRPQEQATNEWFHTQTIILARQHVYDVDQAREWTDFPPHPNPALETVAPLLADMGLCEESIRGYYFLLLLGKVGHPMLRAVLHEW